MYCASKHHEASPGKAEAERDADKWRLDSEDLEALHMCLDRAEVPRHTNFGVVYSAWGRVLKYASLQPEMPTTQPEESDRLFVLLCEIRAAAGDNGERMQSELVPFIAGLARDAERLTWLIDRGLELIACECEVGPPRMWTLGGMSQSLGWFASAREAIDAAIQQGRGTQ
jgi:hypothetical protein